MRNPSRQAPNRFHLLRLPQLHFERSRLGDIFHENFEAAAFFPVRNRASRYSRHDARPILAHAFRGEVVEFLSSVKVIGGLKPLLRIRIQASQVPPR